MNLTWEDIPQESILKLISTMPNESEAIIASMVVDVPL